MKTLADEKIRLHDEWEKVNADLKRGFAISIDEARLRILREFKVPRAVFGKHKPMPWCPYTNGLWFILLPWHRKIAYRFWDTIGILVRDFVRAFY